MIKLHFCELHPHGLRLMSSGPSSISASLEFEHTTQAYGSVKGIYHLISIIKCVPKRAKFVKNKDTHPFLLHLFLLRMPDAFPNWKKIRNIVIIWIGFLNSINFKQLKIVLKFE